MDSDWVMKNIISHLWTKGICFQKMIFIFFTLFNVLEGQSGQGGLEVEMPKGEMPKVEMPKFELPTCTVGGQGQDMTWAENIQSLTKDLEDMTKLWNPDFQILDENATNFIHSLNRFVYSKTFSCLPKYISLNSESLCGCTDEYYTDNDTDNDAESPLSDKSDKKGGDKNGKKDWIHKIKEIIKNAKVTINSNLEAWALKDSFLFFCSTPGLISVVTQLANYCLKRRLKNIRI